MPKKPVKRPRKNLWVCPECGKTVDYGDMLPSDRRTMCDASGKHVQMKKTSDSKRQHYTRKDR
jgi:ribosomal protein L37AE/L43A